MLPVTNNILIKTSRMCNHHNIIIILSCLTSLDSSKPIQKRISVNHEGLSTPITT